jgi:hypothetical protein
VVSIFKGEAVQFGQMSLPQDLNPPN